MEPPLAAYSGGRLLWSTMLLVPHVPSPAYHAAHDMHDASAGAHIKAAHTGFCNTYATTSRADSKPHMQSCFTVWRTTLFSPPAC